MTAIPSLPLANPDSEYEWSRILPDKYSSKQVARKTKDEIKQERLVEVKNRRAKDHGRDQNKT